MRYLYESPANAGLSSYSGAIRRVARSGIQWHSTARLPLELPLIRARGNLRGLAVPDHRDILSVNGRVLTTYRASDGSTIGPARWRVLDPPPSPPVTQPVCR